MTELNDATWFDDRTVSFLRKILSGREVSPFSDNEVKLLKQCERLIELNKMMQGQLIDVLNSAKHQVTVPNALFFLLSTARENKLDEAVETLKMAVREERRLDLVRLREILELSKEMPITWALALSGDDSDDRYAESDVKEKRIKPSDLNGRL